MPTSRDMAIFVLTTMTIQPITLPLAHARGVNIGGILSKFNHCTAQVDIDLCMCCTVYTTFILGYNLHSLQSTLLRFVINNNVVL